MFSPRRSCRHGLQMESLRLVQRDLERSFVLLRGVMGCNPG